VSNDTFNLFSQKAFLTVFLGFKSYKFKRKYISKNCHFIYESIFTKSLLYFENENLGGVAVKVAGGTCENKVLQKSKVESKREVHENYIKIIHIQNNSR